MHILFVFVCLALLISMSTGQSDQSRRKTGIDMYFEQVKSFPPDISPNLPVSTSLPPPLVRLPPPSFPAEASRSSSAPCGCRFCMILAGKKLLCRPFVCLIECIHSPTAKETRSRNSERVSRGGQGGQAASRGCHDG
jgi:hypothetical protein